MLGPQTRRRPITIVGVVGDAVFMSLRHQCRRRCAPLAQWPMGNPPRGSASCPFRRRIAREIVASRRDAHDG
jgi:hypothetical protein